MYVLFLSRTSCVLLSQTVLAEAVRMWEEKNKPSFLHEFFRSDDFSFYEYYMDRGFTTKLFEYQFLFYAARDLYLDETFKKFPGKCFQSAMLSKRRFLFTLMDALVLHPD
jgi:hypothetical protein